MAMFNNQVLRAIDMTGLGFLCGIISSLGLGVGLYLAAPILKSAFILLCIFGVGELVLLTATVVSIIRRRKHPTLAAFVTFLFIAHVLGVLGLFWLLSHATLFVGAFQ